MICATVLPLSRSDAWWVRIFDFPRLQLTLCFIAIFTMYVIVREDPSTADNLFLGLLAVCLAYQLWRMYPYTPLARVEVARSSQRESDSALGILISNVYMDNRCAKVLRELIRETDPDIMLFVETDAWWEQALGDLEVSYPYSVRSIQDNTYGMLLYSRLELRNAEVQFLVQDDVPSIAAEVQLRSGDLIQLRCLHPRPPAPQESERSTERDTELLIVGKELRDRDDPSIVIGDLNDVAWSRTNNLFKRISGLVDPRVGRGFFSTFNAKWPMLRYPLDHVFCSKQFHMVAFKVLRNCGSDHFPVFARLSLQASATAVPREPAPSPHDEAETRKKIDAAEPNRSRISGDMDRAGNVSGERHALRSHSASSRRNVNLTRPFLAPPAMPRAACPMPTWPSRHHSS
jgi:endonuclease/exonuclease/phosphatase (EEP) superfamily protein YafD